MRKIATAVAVGGLVLAMASPAVAQRYPSRDPYNIDLANVTPPGGGVWSVNGVGSVGGIFVVTDGVDVGTFTPEDCKTANLLGTDVTMCNLIDNQGLALSVNTGNYYIEAASPVADLNTQLWAFTAFPAGGDRLENLWASKNAGECEGVYDPVAAQGNDLIAGQCVDKNNSNWWDYT